MKKRVLACLAALTLALSLLPVTALAEEDVVVPGGKSGTAQTEEGSTSEGGVHGRGGNHPHHHEGRQNRQHRVRHPGRGH